MPPCSVRLVSHVSAILLDVQPRCASLCDVLHDAILAVSSDISHLNRPLKELFIRESRYCFLYFPWHPQVQIPLFLQCFPFCSVKIPAFLCAGSVVCLNGPFSLTMILASQITDTIVSLVRLEFLSAVTITFLVTPVASTTIQAFLSAYTAVFCGCAIHECRCRCFLILSA